ncbi:MAG: hypothetical protein IPP71_05165 [Bacteroidetes bacterium]|nr:hypothetical protein [Bacteroidota bacterium]
MEDANVETKFYSKTKPGKPLFFGKKNSVCIFGIPGNPASVLTCYYELVRPALKKYINHPQPGPIVLQLPLANSISKKPGLTHFLKGLTDHKSVTQLQGQESYILKSFISANCFIVLKEMDVEKKTGDIVEVHLI